MCKCHVLHELIKVGAYCTQSACESGCVSEDVPVSGGLNLSKEASCSWLHPTLLIQKGQCCPHLPSQVSSHLEAEGPRVSDGPDVPVTGQPLAPLALSSQPPGGKMKAASHIPSSTGSLPR